MKHLFSFMVLVFITSIPVYGQGQNFFKEYEVDKNSTMIINLDDSSIIIEPSTDDKVHINNYYAFDGYSKKQLEQALKLQAISSNFNESSNHISLIATRIVKNHATYTYKGEGSLFIEEDAFEFTNKKSDSIIRKSKASLIKEIQGNPFNEFGFLDHRIKVKEKDGKVKTLRKRDVRVSTNKFIVKIPPYVSLTVNGKKSQIYFPEISMNELNVNLKSGSFEAKALINNYNTFKIEDAEFLVESVLGGDYTLINLRESKIGALNQVNITSEFSKIEIGEIQKHVRLTDFNSDYWIYNFSDNFERFDMFSEYSKIHYFQPKTDFSMRAFGHNTVMHHGKHQIIMQPTKKGQKYNMFEYKKKGNEVYSGHINLDIVHGIIYNHEDKSSLIKN